MTPDWETLEPMLAGGGALIAWLLILGVAAMVLVGTTMDD